MERERREGVWNCRLKLEQGRRGGVWNRVSYVKARFPQPIYTCIWFPISNLFSQTSKHCEISFKYTHYTYLSNFFRKSSTTCRFTSLQPLFSLALLHALPGIALLLPIPMESRKLPDAFTTATLIFTAVVIEHSASMNFQDRPRRKAHALNNGTRTHARDCRIRPNALWRQNVVLVKSWHRRKSATIKPRDRLGNRRKFPWNEESMGKIVWAGRMYHKGTILFWIKGWWRNMEWNEGGVWNGVSDL